jgi:sugar lactone lactonase YvrE
MRTASTHVPGLGPPGLFACVVALACQGASGSPDRWEATVDTLGDTIVVRTVGGSVWPDTASLAPDLGIGVFEGAEEEMFGEVAAIAASSTGDIFVLDQHVHGVRRFGPDGGYRDTWGREGSGPGELKRPDGMALHPDGRLLVRDPGNARMNVYAPDGQSLPSWPLPGGGGFSTSDPVRVDAAGNVYTQILLEMGADVTEWRYGLARFGPDGTHRDTLKVPTWEFTPARLVARRENSVSSTSVPFSPHAVWDFSPLGYFLGGVSTDYRIDLYRRDQPVLRIERAWAPVPVLAAERDEQERRIIENFKRNFGSWKWNGPGIPDTKPPFRDLAVSQDGRLWIQLSQPGYAWQSQADALAEEQRTSRPQTRYRERTVYDVFEPDGRYLGVVRTPEEFRTSPAPQFRGDTVWAVTRDSLDVQRVVRYRVSVPR